MKTIDIWLEEHGKQQFMTDFSKLPHNSDYYLTNAYPEEIEEGGAIYGLWEDHVKWEEKQKQQNNG